MLKEIFVFAGPNGSGKSTLISKFVLNGLCSDRYICPDQLVPKALKDNLEAYVSAMNEAERIRNEALGVGDSFTFETVFSKRDKLEFLLHAKSLGYRITTVYFITKNYQINIDRVAYRVSMGGHNVPTDKLIDRYYRCLELMPEVIINSDIASVYDSSSEKPVPVMDKNEHGYFLWNREMREEWVGTYLTAPIQERGISIKKDYTVEETEMIRARYGYLKND